VLFLYCFLPNQPCEENWEEKTDFLFKYSGTILEFLGVKLNEIKKKKVVLTMPVNEPIRQYNGDIHGGASARKTHQRPSLHHRPRGKVNVDKG
jgi:hypothetical protein